MTPFNDVNSMRLEPGFPFETTVSGRVCGVEVDQPHDFYEDVFKIFNMHAELRFIQAFWFGNSRSALTVSSILIRVMH